MRIFRPRSRPGRLAFAATALLVGCSTGGPGNLHQSTVWDLIRGTPSSVMLLRIVPSAPDAAPRPARELLAEGLAWTLDWGLVSATDAVVLTAPGNQPSAATGAAGWITVARAPGRHFLRLRAAPEAAPQDFTITVPPERSAVYAGTFRRDCAGDAPASCRLVPVSGDEAAAREAVPESQRAAFPFVIAPAQPYPPRLAGTNLPPPASPTIALDTAQWLAAVDWEAIAAETHADAGRPEGSYTIAAAIGAPFMAAAALGAAAPALAVVGAVAVMVPVGLLSMIVRAERDRRQTNDAAAAQARIEEIRARAAEARAAWSPCESTVAAALAPDSVAPHLQAAMPAPRASQRASRSAAPWQATVTRVVLRRCGAEAGHFGVEVATRWTAPGYDASFVRPVQGATPDRRLRWSTPAPWEVQVGPAGACRPLAEWCAAGGRALLDDVTQSVLGARDAIAATR